MINQLKQPGWIVFWVHLIIALAYKMVVGLTIQPSPAIDWDYFWQTLPVALIQNNLLESLWYLHAQPPLYNLYGAFLIKLFYPDHLTALHFANIVLGATLSGMMVTIAEQFTRSRRFAFVMALVLAFNPALFLYEAYILYTILTAFLVTLSLFCLSLFVKHQQHRFLYAYVLVINLTILTRSLYHLLILLLIIPLMCLLAHQYWKKVLVISLLISLLAVGWYSKNAMIFGFFGASSWQGLGLWKIASFHYSEAELATLVQQHIIDAAVVETEIFSRPSRYTSYGFTQTSTIAALANDDYNNINIPPIAHLYHLNALKLIQHNPQRYFVSVLHAYFAFTKPSSRFVHPTFPANNLVKMGLHEKISSQIQGAELAEALTGLGFSPWLFIAIPTTLGLAFFRALRQGRFSVTVWIQLIRQDSVYFLAALLIFYTILISCFFELGENERFKVLIEQPLWAFIISTLYRHSPWWPKKYLSTYQSATLPSES